MKKRMRIFSFCLVACLLGVVALTSTQATKPLPNKEALLVADFEAGNSSTVGGANWYRISDKIAGGSSSVKIEVIDGGAAKSKKALRMTGTLTADFQYGPFAGMGATVDKNGKDLSAYKGLRFYARGDGATYRVSIPSLAVKDHNEYGKEFVASKTWRLVLIPFNQLKQGDWGRKTTWTGKDVKGVELTANGAPRNFQLDIDQVSFY